MYKEHATEVLGKDMPSNHLGLTYVAKRLGELPPEIVDALAPEMGAEYEADPRAVARLGPTT
jgi:hypothetical protein